MSISLTPVLISRLIIDTTAITPSKEPLQKLAKSQIISIRSITSENTTGYFDIIKKQTRTFSNDRMIIDAMV